MKITYQSTLQAEIDELCDGINRDPDFGHKNDKVILCGTFDHLPCMQEDQVDAENVKNVKAQSSSTITTSIIAMQGQIQAGTMQLDAALAILINIFGITEEIATQILTEKQEVDPSAVPGSKNKDDEDDEETKEQKKLTQKLSFKL